MTEVPDFKTGDRVRHIYHSEYGHGTVLEVEEHHGCSWDGGYVSAPLALVDWDRPSRLTRHGLGLIRKITVFDRLAKLGRDSA